MYLLYLKSRLLSRGRRCVLVGSSPGQAQAAALLLIQRGYDAYVLETGSQEGSGEGR
jgi:rhodanese-related sulfurtransferase